MSGTSYSSKCPNCNNECDVYSDWKPYDYTSIQCIHCGLLINPQIEYMSLEELNNLREEYDLEPLSELPTQCRNL